VGPLAPQRRARSGTGRAIVRAMGKIQMRALARGSVSWVVRFSVLVGLLSAF